MTEKPSAQNSLQKILLNMSNETHNFKPVLADSLMASFVRNANPYENDLNATGASISFHKCLVTTIDDIKTFDGAPQNPANKELIAHAPVKRPKTAFIG